MKKPILLSGLLSVFALPVLAGNTYYVANSGSNSNPGTNALPVKTITYAYSLVSAGDVIIVKPGTYTDYTPWAGLNFNKNGTSANPITIKSQYKWQAIIDGGNVSDHMECMTISGNYHIIDGFDMRGAFECGVWIKGTAKDNQILNNNINHCGNIGDPNSAAGQAGLLSDENTSGTKYYGNYIHHNGRLSINSNLDHGMYLTGDNEMIVNNVVAFNCAYGIHIAGYTTVTNMKVYNNVFAWNGRSGAMVWMDMAGVDFRNNIFYKNAELGLLCYDAHGTGVVIDDNLWYGNPQGTINMTWAGSDVSYTSGNNLIATYPYFINDTSDYHLQSISPAIDAGVVLSPYVTDDMEGTPRPQAGAYDMGPYEYHTSTTGIVSSENNTDVIIFPNPAAEQLTICSASPVASVQLLTAAGEEVGRYSLDFISPGTAGPTIDLGKFPCGNYLIKINDLQGSTTKPIIILR